uniref:EGF-like domain-containing protein n=1 Tax=Leersia perrieri TaxID=77586 RepID=A0A0D9XJS9_9ORYZ
MEDKAAQESSAAAEEKPSPATAPALRSVGDYAVGPIPTVVYVPGFITDSEQSQLLHHIYQAPAPKWKSLKNRRLQNWGGVVHEKGLLPQALPSWLTNITDRICQWTGLFPSAINHVLINEYHPNQGIMPHQDGPAYFPVVAIISLASPVVIDFTPHQRLKGEGCTDPPNSDSGDQATIESNGSHKPEGTNEADPASSSLLLMPCSLLIFKDQAYTDYLHGIQDNELQNIDKVANMSECPEFGLLNCGDSQTNTEKSCGLKQSGTFDRECVFNTSSSPKGIPTTDLCLAINCGPGGQCVKEEGFSYHCACKPGFNNILNLTTLPCIKNCAFGVDCAALGLSSSAPAPTPA